MTDKIKELADLLQGKSPKKKLKDAFNDFLSTVEDDNTYKGEKGDKGDTGEKG